MSQQKHDSLVSVIIPTYGRPSSLVESIYSVLKQDYSTIEIIVVDDNNPNTNSRIETEKLMIDNFSKTKEVKYIKHKYNKNGSAARNTGIKHSTGSFLCFLDDDDLFLESKLSKQIDFLNKYSDYDAVYCGYKANNKNIFPKYKGKLSRELLLMDYQPITSSLMFRREAIENINGFDETFIRHQDYELMLRFFEKHQISYINEILVEIDPTTADNIIRGEKLEELKAYFLSQFKYKIDDLEREKKGTAKEIYSSHYSYVFLTHMNHGFYSRGIRIFFKYITQFPLNFTKDILVRVRDYIKK